MNLYKIILSHHAPKDSQQSLSCLLLASSDEAVYEWLKKDQTLVHSDNIYVGWLDSESEIDEETDEIKVFEIYDDKYNLIGTETFKEKIIRIKGEINDEDYDFCDAYYGITLYGWDCLKENVNESEFQTLIDLNIVYKA